MESLHEEVLEQVLSFLPFPCVVRARLVCKRWLFLLTSPPFFHLWAASHSHPSFWLLFSGLKGTHILSVCQPLCCSLPLHDPSNNTIAASCHGAFLSVSSTSPPRCSLFNPLTQRVLTLPPPTNIEQYLSLGVTANPSFSSFRVISHGLSSSLQTQNPTQHFQYALDGRIIVAELYESASASWILLPPLPLRPQLRQGNYPDLTDITQDFVWWNGSFCILSSRTTHIMTYDLHSSEWGSIELPTSLYKWNPRHVTLHVINDRLFLEGLFRKGGHGHRLIGIVELDHIFEGWNMEMFLMPNECSCRLSRLGMNAHDQYISYSDADHAQICFSPYPSRNQEAIVIFHVDTRVWACENVSHGERRNYYHSSDMKGLTYQPNLVALSFAPLPLNI